MDDDYDDYWDFPYDLSDCDEQDEETPKHGRHCDCDYCEPPA